MSFKKFLVLPLALTAGTLIAKADTIGGLDSPCGSCAGAAYTLTYSGTPVSSTATTQTFQITFDVNDTYYNGGGSFLNAVAIKVASPSNIVSASLLSGPTGFSFVGIEGLNSSGCSSGDNGFLCAQSSGNGASVNGGPYDFVYDVTVNSGTLFTALNQASVKALYVDGSANKVGPIMSENITLQTQGSSVTPEPASFVTLGSGLIGLCAVLRRRRSAN